MISKLSLGNNALVLDPWIQSKRSKPPPPKWSPFVGARSDSQKLYSAWDRFTMRRRNKILNCLALSNLGVNPDDQVLEIGYGSGDGLWLASRLLTTGHAFGIDRSMEMLHSAASRLKRKRAEAQVLRGDVSWLPWSTGSFDKVFCVDGITAWPCTRSGLEEAHRVLRPGGVLVIAEHVSDQFTHAKAVALAHLLSVVGFFSLEVLLIPDGRREALVLRAVRL